MKEWKKEAWGGVNGKDTLIEFVKCKSRESVRERNQILTD